MCLYMTCHACVGGDFGGESDGDGNRQAAKRGINQRCCLTLLLYCVDRGPCYILTTLMQM